MALKKFVAITLLILMVYNLCGFYIVFTALQNSAKAEMREAINSYVPKQLTIFTFEISEGNIADKNFTYADNKDEFRYNGRMYDIVRSEMEGNKISFYCISDTVETELELQFSHHINAVTDSPQSQKNVSLIELCFQQYLPLELHVVNILCPQKFQNHFYYNSSYSEIFLKNSAPPPKDLVS